MKTLCCLVAFILIAVLAGCKKETFNPNEYIDNDLRCYFFKTGTYWVYENSVTHELDSQYVTGYNHKFISGGSPNGHSGIGYAEKFDCDITQFVDGGVYNAKWGVQGKGFGISLTNYINSTNYGLGFSQQSNDRKLIGILDSVMISDSVIHQVYQYRILAASMLPVVLSYDNEFWFSPCYGIIKRIEYGTPQRDVEWNLVRWHISL